MKILQSFLFFDGAIETATSNVLFHSSGSDLTIQIDSEIGDTFTLVIEGLANDKSEEWVVLKGVNMNDFSSTNSITTNGIYSFGVAGINHIRAKITAIDGTLTVFGKLLG